MFQIASASASVARIFHKGMIVLVAIAVTSLMVTIVGHIYVNKSQQITLMKQASSLNDASSILEVAEELHFISSQLNGGNSYESIVLAERSIKETLESLSLRVNKVGIEVSHFGESPGLRDLLESYSLTCKFAFIRAKENLGFQERYQNELSDAYDLSEQVGINLEDRVLETNLQFYADVSKGAAQPNSLENQKIIYEERQRLGELVHSHNELNGYLTYLEKVSDTEEILSLENKYRLKVREFATVSSELGKESNQMVMAFARKLYDSVSGDTMFDIKLQLVEGRQEFVANKEELVALSSRIEEAAGFYREKVIIENADSTFALRKNTALVFAGVITVMALTLLGYVYFVRRLVYSELISPILEITNLTERLVIGDLAQQIPKYRSIELSGMANALDVFRRNALALKQLNADLIKANRDIENFAYAASHDLKSPLRAITNLAMFLREDLEGKLDKESASHLDEIMVRAKRLDNLLNDLLEYAKSSNLETEIKTINTRSFIEEIFSLLNVKGKFSLIVDTDIESITVVDTPLAQILQNLIDNAMKHHDKQTGVIRIQVRDADTAVYHFRVEDDGPGIPPKYHEKVFGLFQILDSKSAEKGSGMGLALVHKIISGFNGDIRITSDPEKQSGTRFDFDWPKAC